MKSPDITLPPASEESSNAFSRRLRLIKLGPLTFKFLVCIFFPIWIWLSIFVLFGSDDLPGGSIFVVVVLGCGGRLLGKMLQQASV